MASSVDAHGIIFQCRSSRSEMSLWYDVVPSVPSYRYSSLLNVLCALQVSSALRDLIISSALQLSAACRATRTTVKLDVYGGKKCLLRSRTCVQGKSLDVNNVSSFIIDEVFEV